MTESEQIQFIKDHPRMGVVNIAPAIGLSYRKTRDLIEKHGIVRFTARTWDDKDDQFLLDNYATMKIEWIMKELNRTKQSIESRANLLGVCRRPQCAKPKEDNEYDKVLNFGRGVIRVAPGHTVYRMGW